VSGGIGSRRFPWREAMAFGLGVLRLPPRDFWALTPRELAAALSGALPHRIGMAPLSRPDLRALMQRFPDVGSDRQLTDR
jgi:uncharacterized phage protein (TIGR02216 family)